MEMHYLVKMFSFFKNKYFRDKDIFVLKAVTE